MGVSIVIGIIVIMTEIIDIELETTANPKTIEEQQYTINKTRRWTPVVIFTIGFALVIVMLGMTMWMTGLRSNISRTEVGLVVPKTNLGLRDANVENWRLSTNSRVRRLIIGEPDWDPKIQWKINKERYDRIRDTRDHWNGKGPAYWNCLRCGYWWKVD